MAALRRTEWVVYAKRPLAGPRPVLKYLARYTHRVAITNRRLVALQDGKVTFRWRDYRREKRTRTMTLEAVEFLRRFLLHVLPRGLQRIRHYGLLANGVRKVKLPLCRSVLGQVSVSPREDKPVADTAKEDAAGPLPSDVCPACHRGRMQVRETWCARSATWEQSSPRIGFDTS